MIRASVRTARPLSMPSPRPERQSLTLDTSWGGHDANGTVCDEGIEEKNLRIAAPDRIRQARRSHDRRHRERQRGLAESEAASLTDELSLRGPHPRERVSLHAAAAQRERRT